MLKRLRVNNFKSLVNVEFRPAAVNLLIGPNNSGKTNLCAAMRFLGLTACGSLRDAIRESVRESWNITNVYSGSDLMEFEVDCSLPSKNGQVDYRYSLEIASRTSAPFGEQYLEIGLEQLWRGQGVLLRRKGDRAQVAPEAFMEIQQAREVAELIDLPTSAKEEPDIRETLVSRLDDPGIAPFRSFLQSWAYYSLSPAALRSASVWRDESGLLSDGSNLCATMFRLHNEKPRLERQIIEIVKALEPKLDLLTYSYPDPESVFMFMEDQQGNRFGVRSISDGTLRFMAMAYLILAAAERGANEPAPLIMIEEPENGLYVGHLKPLIERIENDGTGGQFVFTTHSPYFIDLFDSNLEGVHVMKPGVPSSILTKPEPDRIRKLLEDMPLGELHFREMLA